MDLSLFNGIRSRYNCFKQMVAFCLSAASLLVVTNAPMRAADANPNAVQNVAPASRVKTTVRVDPITGRLVRVTVPLPAAAPQLVRRRKPDPAIQALVEKTATDYNVSPALVTSVISIESDFDPQAVSWKGAQGIMQLMPATARRFGVTDAFDVKQNVEGGVRYLRFLKDTFKDDQLAIAAYNAGEGAVTKYNGIPPYPETMAYVKKVGREYEAAKKAAPGTKPDAASKAQAVAQPPPEEQQPPLVAYFDEHGRLHVTTER